MELLRQVFRETGVGQHSNPSNLCINDIFFSLLDRVYYCFKQGIRRHRACLMRRLYTFLRAHIYIYIRTFKILTPVLVLDIGFGKSFLFL
jgi:hypothetical protein